LQPFRKVVSALVFTTEICNIIIPSVCPSFCATRKCAPYMGALAAAGCTWSVCGKPAYAGKWAGLARRGRWMPRSWAQWAVRVQWGLSQWAVCVDWGLTQRACVSTAGLLTLQFKPQSREARLWLVYFIRTARYCHPKVWYWHWRTGIMGVATVSSFPLESYGELRKIEEAVR